MSEIQKADPRARRRAIITLVLGTLIGCAVILLFQHYAPALQDWMLKDPEELATRIAYALLLFAALFSVPLLAFAVYLWRFGSQVVGAERFPPPGLPTVRDTPVLRGLPARRRGRLAQGLAGCLAFLAGASPTVLWWLLKSLLR